METNNITKEPVAEKVVEKKATTKKKTFKNNDMILCRSITPGELFMSGPRSGVLYIWSDLGDEVEIEYQDLVTIIRTSPSYVTKPYIIIENQDVVDAFPQIKKVYDNMYTTGDLNEIFDLPISDMKVAISCLPDGAKDAIQKLASTKITNGTLDSVKKIKALDEIFDTKMVLMTNLFND